VSFAGRIALRFVSFGRHWNSFVAHRFSSPAFLGWNSKRQRERRTLKG
jgi:hypothetical protein